MAESDSNIYSAARLHCLGAQNTFELLFPFYTLKKKKRKEKSKRDY